MLANLTLFSIITVIWGSTWLVITFQLSQVPPVLSVAWRFGVAAAVLFIICVITRRRLRYRPVDHLYLAGYGLGTFGFCYVLCYLASELLTSGLVATVFSLILIMNIVNLRLFLGAPIRTRAVLGGLAGLAGLVLVFHREIMAFSLTSGVKGLILGVIASYCASLGNVIATRNSREGIGPAPANAYGMAYGTLFVLAWHLISGGELVIDLSFSYLGPMLYLSLFGSVVAFVCYLSLIQRIGADLASYVGTISPVLALILSTIYEGYTWTGPALAGVAMVLLGNVIILTPTRRIKARWAGIRRV